MKDNNQAIPIKTNVEKVDIKNGPEFEKVYFFKFLWTIS